MKTILTTFLLFAAICSYAQYVSYNTDSIVNHYKIISKNVNAELLDLEVVLEQAIKKDSNGFAKNIQMINGSNIIQVKNKSGKGYIEFTFLKVKHGFIDTSKSIFLHNNTEFNIIIRVDRDYNLISYIEKLGDTILYEAEFESNNRFVHGYLKAVGFRYYNSFRLNKNGSLFYYESYYAQKNAKSLRLTLFLFKNGKVNFVFLNDSLGVPIYFIRYRYFPHRKDIELITTTNNNDIKVMYSYSIGGKIYSITNYDYARLNPQVNTYIFKHWRLKEEYIYVNKASDDLEYEIIFYDNQRNVKRKERKIIHRYSSNW